MASSGGFKEMQTIQAGMALSWSVLFFLLVLFLLLGFFVWAMHMASQQAQQIHRSKGHLS